MSVNTTMKSDLCVMYHSVKSWQTQITEHLSHTVSTFRTKETFYTFNIGNLKAMHYSYFKSLPRRATIKLCAVSSKETQFDNNVTFGKLPNQHILFQHRANPSDELCLDCYHPLLILRDLNIYSCLVFKITPFNVKSGHEYISVFCHSD